MSLIGRVCLVTGASRGIGKGIARALTSQGAKVYITGRNETSLSNVSAELGVNAIPIVCDHSDDLSIEKLFNQIDTDNNGQLDFLVNNCFSAALTLLGKDSDAPVNKFWEQDPLIWDKINGVGLRANYIASVHAARLMVPRANGIIVNISSAGGLTYSFNTAYGVGKAAQDRMAQDFNVELKDTGVHALAVWPLGVKTELSYEHILNNESPDKDIQMLKSMVSMGQTPDWVGRTVAALLTDKKIAKKAGRVIWCNDIADEFGILENDGSAVLSHRSFRSCFIMAGQVGIPIPFQSILAKYTPTFLKLPAFVYNIILWGQGNKF